MSEEADVLSVPDNLYPVGSQPKTRIVNRY
jgi:hypothetical protein